MNKDTIILPARYGYKHTLEHIKDNLWAFQPDPNSTGTYRIIYDNENTNNLHALDPEGGPFMYVGAKIDGYTIKSISRDGIFELEQYEED